MTHLERLVTAIILGFVLMYGYLLNTKAERILARADSLNKRADVMEKQWALLDKRIRKQEGIKHGFGY